MQNNNKDSLALSPWPPLKWGQVNNKYVCLQPSADNRYLYQTKSWWSQLWGWGHFLACILDGSSQLSNMNANVWPVLSSTQPFHVAQNVS